MLYGNTVGNKNIFIYKRNLLKNIFFLDNFIVQRWKWWKCFFQLYFQCSLKWFIWGWTNTQFKLIFNGICLHFKGSLTTFSLVSMYHAMYPEIIFTWLHHDFITTKQLKLNFNSFFWGSWKLSRCIVKLCIYLMNYRCYHHS